MTGTTNPEQKVLDEIDELVDWQLGQESSGYDNNVNQPQCRCGEDWHALPITSRLRSMRVTWQLFGLWDDTYEYASDDSTILCPGSEVEGPLQQLWFRFDSPAVGAPRRCTCLVCANGFPQRMLEDMSSGFDRLNRVLSSMTASLARLTASPLWPNPLLTVPDNQTDRGAARTLYWGRQGGPTYDYAIVDEVSVLSSGALTRINQIGARARTVQVDGSTLTVDFDSPRPVLDDLDRVRLGVLDPDGPVRTYRIIRTVPVATNALPVVGLPVNLEPSTRQPSPARSPFAAAFPRRGRDALRGGFRR